MKKYDVVVIGAGHAGIEACLAASRMGVSTLLVTFSRATIGLMSCNPAIGGVGKGQLVKEIDALGGEMAKAADACAIQFRVLNASKGPAVHSSRAQIDMRQYNQYMRRVVEAQPGLDILEGEIGGLLVEDGRVQGVRTTQGQDILASCVVVATGTFLDGLIHVGMESKSGGRVNEPASHGLPLSLASLGFSLLRFKTGTCPRIDARSIAFRNLKPQYGDEPPHPFSFSTHTIPNRQVPCHITYTNERTHGIIRENLSRSPMYTGVIKATGVRYCPSIEDKIVKFSDKPRHQVFLEPQGLDTDEVYPNGISTSLPEDVQDAILHSIEGLEECRVIRYGYGIEHTVVEPTQLYPTLETKLVQGLYCAGQINGTTGYEEAASQGLVAGINAALACQGREPMVLDRASGYIGVLIDDLTTKGTREPYRMFTSRVEYRLLLREDNADLRLAKYGFQAGLLSKSAFALVQEKEKAVVAGKGMLASSTVHPGEEVNNALLASGTSALKRPATLEDLLKRPGVDIALLARIDGRAGEIPDFARQQVEIAVKYAGFIQRQLKEVERFEHLEKVKVPQGLDFNAIPGISREIREKLARSKPVNLGQASRISGVTPAAVSILMVYLRKLQGSAFRNGHATE